MTLTLSQEKLGELLVADGKISREQLKDLIEAGKNLGKNIFQLMMEREVLSEAFVMEFLGDQLKIPVMSLNSIRIPKELTTIVPRKLVEKYQILPLSRIGRMMTVATADPFEVLVRDDIRELAKCDVNFVLCAPKVIAASIESYYGDSANLEELLEGIDEESLEVIREGGGADDKMQVGVDDAPVVRMVNLIIDEAIRLRASDIHFEPYEKNFRVRYRIDGSLRESFNHAKEMYGALVARIKIMSVLDITEKRLPQDGRFRVKIRNREIDFRVSVLPIYHGEKMVLRVLDRSGVRSGLKNLGFSEKPTNAFAEAVKSPYGMILVTGPTGSGKSTTLYTILNSMNTPDRNIMTVEDPVEYQLEGITQTQVHSEVGLTFASGLRSLLRQSPDIILIGEIRDTETADIGVKAALTGHLVFSTLHTNSAAGAMTRLVDMGVEPFLIASSVVCVAAQRLVKKICEHCKAPVEITDDQRRRSGLKDSDLKGVTLYKGKGCSQCNQSGYYGRIATIEVLKVDSDIRNLVIQRKSSDVIEKVAIQNGMETLFENAFGICKQGLTTLEEVLRVSTKE